MTCGRLPGGGAAPPLRVNGKPDSTNPRKGSATVVGVLRPELFNNASRNVSERIPHPGTRSSLLSSIHEAVKREKGAAI
ncbi:hypothetical protein AMTR_s00105p00134620 [Amborella trichopoda]|uniref:Uncharacterized protein n=1 Tax=Amborella trichopoda TaxID=13333 RepID=W1NSI3_AMBTC|nr:hypothetical protein AMTR_s00105p00134620 [Amborella trichopoda]